MIDSENALIPIEATDTPQEEEQETPQESQQPATQRYNNHGTHQQQSVSHTTAQHLCMDMQCQTFAIRCECWTAVSATDSKKGRGSNKHQTCSTINVNAPPASPKKNCATIRPRKISWQACCTTWPA